MTRLQCSFRPVNRILLLGLISAMLPLLCDAETTGPRTPTVIVTSDGSPPWTSPELAAVSDDAYASITTDDTSHIRASGFGFSIPADAVVTEVIMTVERHSASGLAPLYFVIMVTQPDGTTHVGIGFEEWSTVDLIDSWTHPVPDVLFLDSLPAAEVNDPAFGMTTGVNLGSISPTETYFIDSMTMEIIYEGPFVPQDPCDDLPGAIENFPAFTERWVRDAPLDIEGDGLPEEASLSLMEAIACIYEVYDPLAGALVNAYNINLEIFDGADVPSEFAQSRSLVALLMVESASLEVRLIEELKFADPPLNLHGNFVQATCVDGQCMPESIRGVPLDEEFIDFARASRAVDEPFSGRGDLDEDGTDNRTEYENVMAQGGTLADFVNAATDPLLDGTEPLGTSVADPGDGGGGGGGCLIATAAYGTPLAEEIHVLRSVRDRLLLKSALGAAFVDFYYRASPPVADVVAGHDRVAAGVRVLLVPVIFVAGQPALAVLLFGVLFAALVFGVYRRRIRRFV